LDRYAESELGYPKRHEFETGDYAWWRNPPSKNPRGGDPVAVQIGVEAVGSEWDWVVKRIRGNPRPTCVYARDLTPMNPLEVLAAASL